MITAEVVLIIQTIHLGDCVQLSFSLVSLALTLTPLDYGGECVCLLDVLAGDAGGGLDTFFTLGHRHWLQLLSLLTSRPIRGGHCDNNSWHSLMTCFAPGTVNQFLHINRLILPATP